MRADYITNVKNKLKRFSDFLADKPWSAGNEVRPLYPTSAVLGCVCVMVHAVAPLQITYPDFPLYELLDQHRTFEPTILDDFPNLRVSSLSGLCFCYCLIALLGIP